MALTATRAQPIVERVWGGNYKGGSCADSTHTSKVVEKADEKVIFISF